MSIKKQFENYFEFKQGENWTEKEFSLNNSHGSLYNNIYLYWKCNIYYPGMGNETKNVRQENVRTNSYQLLKTWKNKKLWECP